MSPLLLHKISDHVPGLLRSDPLSLQLRSIETVAEIKARKIDKVTGRTDRDIGRTRNYGDRYYRL